MDTWDNVIIDDMSSSTTIIEMSTKHDSECKVCGASANCSYVGVRTCFPCKMFFKRNAETKVR